MLVWQLTGRDPGTLGGGCCFLCSSRPRAGERTPRMGPDGGDGVRGEPCAVCPPSPLTPQHVHTGVRGPPLTASATAPLNSDAASRLEQWVSQAPGWAPRTGPSADAHVTPGATCAPGRWLHVELLVLASRVQAVRRSRSRNPGTRSTRWMTRSLQEDVAQERPEGEGRGGGALSFPDPGHPTPHSSMWSPTPSSVSPRRPPCRA